MLVVLPQRHALLSHKEGSCRLPNHSVPSNSTITCAEWPLNLPNNSSPYRSQHKTLIITTPSIHHLKAWCAQNLKDCCNLVYPYHILAKKKAHATIAGNHSQNSVWAWKKLRSLILLRKKYLGWKLHVCDEWNHLLTHDQKQITHFVCFLQQMD